MLEIKLLTLDNYSKDYHNWLNDKQINKYLESRFFIHSKQSVKDFIKQCTDNENVYLYGIFQQNKHIGNIKVDINPHHKYCTVGLMIGDKNYHRQGFAKKSMLLVIKKMKNLKLNKIQAGVYENNIASNALLTSLGFNKICTFKNQYLYEDKYINSHFYELFL